ncbi:hypothetical protein BYT27DRAFT_7262880 [Phlegmacium glaucopus]|nr:hypothetical protein BYT27DRAFT_7262880 [Phlegmacium glaucopus]
MATPELLEPMNSSPYHSKVKITTTLSDPTFVAGYWDPYELSSRDHSATSTFLHSRRLFQPALKRHDENRLFYSVYPSQPHLLLPSLLDPKLVVDNKTVDVVEAYPYDKSPPEAIVVGDNGKLWMQGRMIGGPVVAGRTAYWELQVKNHSNKKNSSLTLTLTRTLYLPGQQQLQQPTTAQISDTLATVPFRGPEYIIPPGAEGVANLVFDVPKLARGVQGGTLDGESEEDRGQPRN